MARRQTRKCISLKAETYARLRNYCRRSGVSISGMLEQVIAEELTALGEPEVPREVALQCQPVPRDVETHSGIFTF